MPDDNLPKDFCVAVVGGGMCGLAIAIGLIRKGINVKVFEAAAKFDEVGAGVGLGPNAIQALKGLGILDAVLKAVNKEGGTNPAIFQFVAASESHEHIYTMPHVESDDIEKKGLDVYRPTFLAALTPLIPADNVAFLKRLSSVTQLPSGEYRLNFTDSSTYNADLVVGADGVKSKVRDAVVDPSEPNGPVAFSNQYVYRGLVPVEDIKAAGMTLDLHAQPYAFVGPGKLMVTYPIRNSKMINFSGSFNTREVGAPPSSQEPPPWVEEIDRQELLNAYKGDWGHDGFAFLKAVKKPSRWKLHTIYPPLTSYVKDKVVLIGDAAHAMVPYLGAGGGQGLEDAYVLYKLLVHPNVRKANLEAALVTYDTLRLPRANMVLQKSLEAGEIMQSLGPGRKTLDEVRKLIKGVYESEWHKQLWNYDLEGEISKVLETL